MLRAAHMSGMRDRINSPGGLYVPLFAGPQMAGGGEGVSHMKKPNCPTCGKRAWRVGLKNGQYRYTCFGRHTWIGGAPKE